MRNRKSSRCCHNLEVRITVSIGRIRLCRTTREHRSDAHMGGTAAGCCWLGFISWTESRSPEVKNGSEWVIRRWACMRREPISALNTFPICTTAQNRHTIASMDFHSPSPKPLCRSMENALGSVLKAASADFDIKSAYGGTGAGFIRIEVTYMPAGAWRARSLTPRVLLAGEDEEDLSLRFPPGLARHTVLPPPPRCWLTTAVPWVRAALWLLYLAFAIFSLVCFGQNSAFLRPSTPRGGTLLQPRRSHFLPTKFTIPPLSCSKQNCVFLRSTP